MSDWTQRDAGTLTMWKRNTFSSTNLLTQLTVADKLVLVNPFDEITICSLLIVLLIRCFKSIFNDIVSTKIYDKRDDFDFEIVNFPF